jgi:hypothetical protein
LIEISNASNVGVETMIGAYGGWTWVMFGALHLAFMK